MEVNNLGGFFNVFNWQVANPLIFRGYLIPKMGTTGLAFLLASRTAVSWRTLSLRSDPNFPPSTGSSRRYQVNAVHTSKACNIISKYTAYVPVDVSKSRYLPTVVAYPNSGKADRRPGHS